MRNLIENLNCFKHPQIKIIACCCGHNKYPKSVVIDAKHGIYELFTGKFIPRKTRFYKRDKQGYFYIPEVVNAGNR